MERYNNQDLELFEKKLLELKAKEENQLEDIEKELKKLGENGKDENNIDTTSYAIQFESLFSSKLRLMKHLRQVESALLRIKNKQYGICIETGLLIPKARLMAIPTTTLSIEGKLNRQKKPSRITT